MFRDVYHIGCLTDGKDAAIAFNLRGAVASGTIGEQRRAARICGLIRSRSWSAGGWPRTCSRISLDREFIELRFARRAPAYLGRLARRLRVLDPSRLADMLDDAIEAGRLTEADREQAMLADVVALGRRRGDDAEAYFVAEVSSGIGVSDVRRSLERADMLAKLGQPVVPAVAGRWINSEAQTYARSSGVEQVLIPRRPSLPEYEPPPT